MLPLPDDNDGGGTPDPDGGGGGSGTPKTFTQADVDRIVGERLERQKATLTKDYADYGDLKAKAEQFDQLQAANQTDLERATSEAADWKARFEAAESARAEAELTALRHSVAVAKGLPAALAKRLTGSTREEIEADADDLLEVAPARRGPKPDPNARRHSSNHSASVEAGRARYAEKHAAK